MVRAHDLPQGELIMSCKAPQPVPEVAVKPPAPPAPPPKRLIAEDVDFKKLLKFLFK